MYGVLSSNIWVFEINVLLNALLLILSSFLMFILCSACPVAVLFFVDYSFYTTWRELQYLLPWQLFPKNTKTYCWMFVNFLFPTQQCVFVLSALWWPFVDTVDVKVAKQYRAMFYWTLFSLKSLFVSAPRSCKLLLMITIFFYDWQADVAHV